MTVCQDLNAINCKFCTLASI